MTKSEELIEADRAEEFEHGQDTRGTFQLSDVFIAMDELGEQVQRFLDLVFGYPLITPTAEEHAMFMAYAASLRSGDLSRQVGAAIIDRHGDLLAVGCNEVPKCGGGHYGPEPGSKRDIERGEDSNEAEKRDIIGKVMVALGYKGGLDEATKILKPTGLTNLTEFGRSVHAEMQALLACARTSGSPRGATLYSTTSHATTAAATSSPRASNGSSISSPIQRARPRICTRMPSSSMGARRAGFLSYRSLESVRGATSICFR